MMLSGTSYTRTVTDFDGWIISERAFVRYVLGIDPLSLRGLSLRTAMMVVFSVFIEQIEQAVLSDASWTIIGAHLDAFWHVYDEMNA